MSERDTVTAGLPGLTEPATLGEQPQTAGAMLRQLRLSAGVDAALVASAMKVPVQKLEALENDRYEQLPDVTFARGLASAICRAFGVDPAPVLERMPVAAPGLRPRENNVNQPFKRASDRPAPLMGGSFSKPLVIAVGVLLVGAAALWLLPTLPIQLGAPTPASESPAGAPGTVRESVNPPVALEPVAGPAEMPLGAASAEQGAAPTVPAASGPRAAATPAAADEVLRFEANGETWITVRDATGKALVNRAMSAGETLNVGGALPLAVTVGRKEAVAVSVRGQPFDHKALGPSSVARFQVK